MTLIPYTNLELPGKRKTAAMLMYKVIVVSMTILVNEEIYLYCFQYELKLDKLQLLRRLRQLDIYLPVGVFHLVPPRVHKNGD